MNKIPVELEEDIISRVGNYGGLYRLSSTIEMLDRGWYKQERNSHGLMVLNSGDGL